LPFDELIISRLAKVSIDNPWLSWKEVTAKHIKAWRGLCPQPKYIVLVLVVLLVLGITGQIVEKEEEEENENLRIKARF